MRSKISALGVKRTLIILAESLLVISLFFVSGAVIKNNAEASYNNKSRSFSSSYYFDRYRNFYNSVGQHIVDRRRITSGYTYANHTVGMTAGGYSVNVGNPINFAHSPTLTFVSNGGAWDTPYGTWCSNINSKCVGGFGGVAYDAVSSNYALVHWTGLRPGASMTSSNPSVISCSGMNCTALSPGTATLTATGASTPARIWVYTGFANNTNWVYTSETHEASLNGTTYMNNRMTIGGGAIGSWPITVTVPNNPPVAIIDEIYNNRTNTGPFYTSEVVNFRGTATDSDGNVVAYRWGSSCGDNSYSSIEDPNSLTLPGTAGNYIIYFRAQDNQGAWSACDANAVQTITIVDPPEDGVCDSDREGTFACDVSNWPAASDYCASGSPSNTPSFPTEGNPVTWSCLGINASIVNDNCSAEVQPSIAASCGSADGELLVNIPSGADLCGLLNTSSSVIVNGDFWEWTCTGACSNPVSVSCSAEINTASNWIEVPANQ